MELVLSLGGEPVRRAGPDLLFDARTIEGAIARIVCRRCARAGIHMRDLHRRDVVLGLVDSGTRFRVHSDLSVRGWPRCVVVGLVRARTKIHESMTSES